eukprot:753946-Hanusia_phi.AAC.2
MAASHELNASRLGRSETSTLTRTGAGPGTEDRPGTTESAGEADRTEGCRVTSHARRSAAARVPRRARRGSDSRGVGPVLSTVPVTVAPTLGLPGGDWTGRRPGHWRTPGRRTNYAAGPGPGTGTHAASLFALSD